METPSLSDSPSPFNYIYYPSPSSDIDDFTPSPSSKKKSSIDSPSSLTKIDQQDIIPDNDNMDIGNETERKDNNDNDNNSNSEIQYDNTFIIVTIILSTILVVLLLVYIIKFFIRKNLCKISFKTIPEEKKEEVDLEIGEKNKIISNNKELSQKSDNKIVNKISNTNINPPLPQKTLEVQKPPISQQKPSISTAVPITKKKRKLIGGRGKNAIRKTKLNLKTVKQFGQRKTDKIESPAIKRVVNRNVTMYNMKSNIQEKLKDIENKKNKKNNTENENDDDEII